MPRPPPKWLSIGVSRRRSPRSSVGIGGMASRRVAAGRILRQSACPAGAFRRRVLPAVRSDAAEGVGTRSDVEEDGLALALQADVEAVDRAALAAFGVLALADERLAAALPLDEVDHRVLRVRLGLVAEVHAGVQADVDASRDDPEVHVRGHHATVAAHHRPGLDGVEAPDACLEIAGRATPAAKVRVDRLVGLAVAGVVVAPGSVRLPDLD